MEITNDIVEQYDFKRINNSMWRLGKITLQNGYTCKGKTLNESITSITKAYRVCLDGKYQGMITTIKELEIVKKHHETWK